MFNDSNKLNFNPGTVEDKVTTDANGNQRVARGTNLHPDVIKATAALLKMVVMMKDQETFDKILSEKMFEGMFQEIRGKSVEEIVDIQVEEPFPGAVMVNFMMKKLKPGA